MARFVPGITAVRGAVAVVKMFRALFQPLVSVAAEANVFCTEAAAESGDGTLSLGARSPVLAPGCDRAPPQDSFMRAYGLH